MGAASHKTSYNARGSPLGERSVEEFGGTDRFRVIRPLGKGGMGAVYEVQDREHDERIALKTLRYTNAHYLYCLKKEFRILQGLHHPNLIRLGELIEERGRWFFTMELIQGADFLAYVRDARRANGKPDRDDAIADTQVPETRPVTEDEVPKVNGRAVTPAPYPAGDAPTLDTEPVTRLATLKRDALFDERRLRAGLRGMVDGLSVLHDAGLVHRDVKPSNVMVTMDQRVVLLDFGLVHVQRRREEAFATGTELMGTPGYMAPEQYGGAEVTPASDWYSVGATLYESLTGRLPFMGSPLAILNAARKHPPLPPSQFIDGVPADLERLCLELLDAEPTNRPTPDAIRDVLGEAPAYADSHPSFSTARSAASSSGEFVGRSREMAELRHALAETRSGRAASIFIGGASGMGKTALVRQFLDDVEAEGTAVVLTGRCYERESVPYKAFDSLVDDLRWYLETLPGRDRVALLPDDPAPLVRLFPVLDLRKAGTPPTPDGANPHDLRAQSFAALKQLFHNLASRRQLILFIDDLQWGDVDSAELLRELLREPEAPPMLLIGTYRTDDANDPALASVLADRHCVELAPLSDEEARLLVNRMSADHRASLASLADDITREAQGSPFFLGEMVRHLGAQPSVEALPPGGGGPALLHRLITERIATLPDDAVAMLQAAAVIGRPVSKQFLVKVAELARPDGRRALETLDQHKMVRTVQRDEVGIYHDQLREAVLAGLSAEDVRGVYQRVAAVLEDSTYAGSPLFGIDFMSSIDPERALRYAIGAAEQAEAAFAFERAARLYELAIDLAPNNERRDLRKRYAHVLQWGGFAANAADVFQDLARTAEPDEAVDLSRIAADCLLRAGHIEEGLHQLEEVASALGVKLGRTRSRTLLSIAANRLRITMRGIGYRPRPADECDGDALVRLDSMFSAATTLGQVDFLKGAVLQTEHLLDALKLGEEHRACRALAVEVAFLAFQGGRSLRRAEKLAREVLLHADELGDPYLLGGAYMGTAYIKFFSGQYPLAHESFLAAEAHFRRCPDAWWELCTVRYWDYLVMVSMGDFNGLAASLPSRIKEAEQRNDRHTRSALKGHPTVWYLLREDRPVDVDDELDAAVEEWPVDGKYLAHYTAAIGRVMVRLYEGDAQDALRILDESTPLVKSLFIHRMPYTRSELDKLRAMAAARLGDRAMARAPLRALDKYGLPIARAYASAFRAPFAHADGDDREARRLLLEALTLFEESGAQHDAAACRYRAGVLIGGERGQQLVDDALAWMDAQGVRHPARMLDYLLPGFDTAT